MSRAFHSGFVSIVGRPNAGKSTLLNALIGEKVAITAHQAQTTRTSIQGVLTTPDAQVVFVDTPGIHKSDSLLNKRMMETVRGALQDRDLILFIADALRPPDEDAQAIDALPKQTPAFLVLNKIDRVDDKRLLLPAIEQYSRLFAFAQSIPVSARKGEGIDRLKESVITAMPTGERHYPNDYLTDQPLRFMAAEIVREHILRNTREEVPHASAILIDKWDESEKLVKIAATIHVERTGQRVILLGAAGATLKKIGTAARLELERLLERKVFLALYIKVKPKWREDPSFLAAVDWRAMLGTEGNKQES